MATYSLDSIDGLSIRAEEMRDARGYTASFRRNNSEALSPIEHVFSVGLSGSLSEFYEALEEEGKARVVHQKAEERLSIARARLSAFLDHLDTVPIPAKE